MKELFLFKGKDTCKSRVGQILKRQKKLLNCKTVWEILLTSKVAEAETGSGRGGETSSLHKVLEFLHHRSFTQWSTETRTGASQHGLLNSMLIGEGGNQRYWTLLLCPLPCPEGGVLYTINVHISVKFWSLPPRGHSTRKLYVAIQPFTPHIISFVIAETNNL